MLSDDRHNPLGRFDGLAAIYDRYRPGYPEQALDFIVELIGDRELPIADVGAGTGILSRQLAGRGWRVVGIEPNGSMRERAAVSDSPGAVEFREGRAEETGLAAGSVCAVVAAQSFHWCDPDPSLREFHRILAPGQWATLMWNIADTHDPFTEQFWSLQRAAAPEREIVERSHDSSGRAILTHPLFESAIERVVPNFQEIDEEALIGRAFSASFAPKECTAASRLADSLRELYARFVGTGPIRLVYRTILYQARARARRSGACRMPTPLLC